MDQAVTLYTLSISFAMTGSKELALAYGNRSAALFEKQFYKECLEDIQRAFENDYPQEKKAKLLGRQTKAEALLPTQKNLSCRNTIPTIKSRNPNIPSASECIKINKDTKFGRHIVANRSISPGEILLVEKPYSQFLFPDHSGSRCSECFEFCFNMIPCEKCSAVLYCTKACRRKAYVDYHRYECTILLHFGYDIIDWTAIRMTLKGIKEYYKETTDPEVYRSNRYKEISELTSHRSEDLKIILAVRACGVAKVFYALKKYTDIFSVLDVDNKENVLKTLLFNSLYISQRNSFNVNLLGRAIYSTLSMFNHACNENVGHAFYGSTVVLRATREIKAGEQCFINYGFSPIFDSKRKRREVLKDRYLFTCRCQACVQNWPNVEVLSAETSLWLSNLKMLYMGEFLGDNIDQQIKLACSIIKRIELESPFLAYVQSKYILDIILFKGQNVSILF